ncbi:MAG: FkbM family methyltransferase [Vicinamibacteria bacterium]|nr:FkbM family methyltransferase [Vicinamibacteria bacterium]
MLSTKQKIAIARLAQAVVMAARRLAGLGAETHVTRNGARFALDLREGIDFSIWLLGTFEPETVRCYQQLLRPGNVVLDIGANVGAHTLFLARAVGETGRVVAIEPTDYAFSKLSANCALNPELAERIQCVQAMLVASEDGAPETPRLYSSWPLAEERELHGIHQGRLMTTSGARARTLDSVARELALDRVDCIKLDIDGFECGMIRGAGEVLERWHPTIVMELAPYALREQGESLHALLGLLAGHGYALFDMATGEPLSPDAAVLEARIPQGASWNVLARAAGTVSA